MTAHLVLLNSLRRHGAVAAMAADRKWGLSFSQRFRQCRGHWPGCQRHGVLAQLFRELAVSPGASRVT